MEPRLQETHTRMLDRLRSEERKQIRIDLVFVSRAQAVRRAFIDFQCGARDELGREQRRGANRHDLVIIAVHDERGYGDLFEIFCKVRLGERLDAIDNTFETGLHPLKPERIPQALRNLGAGSVSAIERRGELLEELRPVGQDTGADLVESFYWQAVGIGLRLQHQRRYGTD